MQLTAIAATESRPPSVAETLELPPAARLGCLGRKAVVNENVAEKICLLLSLGFSQRQTAAYLGISPSSIANAAARSAELAGEFQQARDRQHMQPELTILAEAQKNWRAAAWFLTYKTKNPRPLTEEEKEERHQAHLADQRRSAELTNQQMRDFAAATDALGEKQRAQSKLMLRDLMATSFPEGPNAEVRRKGKKRVRGK